METIKFTKAELNHLATLIEDNERDGTYYGNRKQYWKRSLELKQKLLLSTVSRKIDIIKPEQLSTGMQSKTQTDN